MYNILYVITYKKEIFRTFEKYTPVSDILLFFTYARSEKSHNAYNNDSNITYRLS